MARSAGVANNRHRETQIHGCPNRRVDAHRGHHAGHDQLINRVAKTPDGELVPSRDADANELLGIGSALGVTGTGAFLDSQPQRPVLEFRKGLGERLKGWLNR